MNAAFIANSGCNETCPENCISSWIAFAWETQGNITKGTSPPDENIKVSCGKSTLRIYLLHLYIIFYADQKYIWMVLIITIIGISTRQTTTQRGALSKTTTTPK